MNTLTPPNIADFTTTTFAIYLRKLESIMSKVESRTWMIVGVWSAVFFTIGIIVGSILMLVVR